MTKLCSKHRTYKAIRPPRVPCEQCWQAFLHRSTKHASFSDATASKTKNVSYGYVGFWRNGALGWLLPVHAAGGKGYTEPPNRFAAEYVRDEDLFALCRITIEVVPGVRRRRHPGRKRHE